jgi:hypothetical protein
MTWGSMAIDLVGGAVAELEGPGVELEFGERVDHRLAVAPEERRPGSYRGGRRRPAHAADRRGEPGDPRPVGSGFGCRWVRVSIWVSAGGRQEHLVDDVHDAVAGLDVGLDD